MEKELRFERGPKSLIRTNHLISQLHLYDLGKLGCLGCVYDGSEHHDHPLQNRDPGVDNGQSGTKDSLGIGEGMERMAYRAIENG